MRREGNEDKAEGIFTIYSRDPGKPFPKEGFS